MRRATSNYSILVNEDEFVGISLGADFTSEHEWGIKGMRETFGIPESSKKTMGVKSRTITHCPNTLLFKRGDDWAVLWVAYEDWYPKKQVRQELPSEIANFKDHIKWEQEWYEKELARAKKSKEKDKYVPEKKDPLVTAWDEKTFGVAVVGKQETEWLEFLYKQFQNKNIAISMMNMSPNNPFSNSSLTLAIRDRLPKEVTDLMYQADKKYYDLQDYEKKIGMVKLKERVKKQRQKKAQESNSHYYQGLHYYMACSPSWIDYEDTENRKKKKEEWGTKYDILYWINYSDDDSNYGWYTVEQIKEWLSGDKTLLEVVPKKEKE